MKYIKHLLKTSLVFYLGFRLGYGCAIDSRKKDVFHKGYYQTLEEKLK